MQYRTLGRTGLRVSEIGVGGAQFGLTNYMGAWDAHSDEAQRATTATVRRALELGYTYFDTAPGYGDGRGEELLGVALKGHRDELHERFGPRPPRPLPLYVTLCYRELETDPVPLPREEEGVPTRIAEGFELALRLDPPPQQEEMAVRRLGAELAAIKPISRPRTLDLDAARQAIADRVRWLRTPPELAPSPEPLPIEPGWRQAVLHTALRVWVTEVRPALLEEQGPCVLLARLDLALAENWRLASEPTVVEDERPLLLHTRLLQERLGI